MPCFESSKFYQNKLKIKLFLQNNTNFLSAEDPLPDSRNSLVSPPPPLQISGYAFDARRVLLVLPIFRIIQLAVFELVKQQPLFTV